MGKSNEVIDASKLSKQEKIKLVKDELDKIKTELGPNYAYITKTRICAMAQDRLPMQPMYDVATINMILNGTYE